MKKHSSGDPKVNAEHIEKQRKGDKELAGHGPSTGDGHKLNPGTGRPDAEEGVGMVQNQRR